MSFTTNRLKQTQNKKDNGDSHVLSNLDNKERWLHIKQ